MNNDINNTNNTQDNPSPAAAFTTDPNQQPPQQNPYQQTPYQQNPYQQNPYQQNPYQQTPYQQNPYQQSYVSYTPVPVQQESNTMGVLSIVFSALGIFCCGIPFGITGVILGALYAKKNKKSPLGWIGLGLGILAIVLAIASLFALGGIEGYTEMLEEITDNI